MKTNTKRAFESDSRVKIDGFDAICGYCGHAGIIQTAPNQRWCCESCCTSYACPASGAPSAYVIPEGAHVTFESVDPDKNEK